MVARFGAEAVARLRMHLGRTGKPRLALLERVVQIKGMDRHGVILQLCVRSTDCRMLTLLSIARSRAC